MAKEAKKQTRRLKRRIRKTFGALFMASAITIAAIPVENIRAGSSEPSEIEVGVKDGTTYTKYEISTLIPKVSLSEQIYTTGDGRFQFAYVQAEGAADKVAVILGYGGGQLQGATLEIPDYVDAYRKYKETMGTAEGYCAVGKDNDCLFFEVWSDKTDERGNVVTEDDLSQPIKDEEGNIIGYEQIPVKVKSYQPCYYKDYEKWGNLDDDQLFYESGVTASGPEYAPTITAAKQRIRSATVMYIGNQYLEKGEGANSGTWTVAGDVTSPEQGVFYGTKAGNIETLILGKNLSGIGNYAFYKCGNLSSITLNNGLDTIGNYAFAECGNLERVSIDMTARLSGIGHHAFYNCIGLKSFDMPIQVSAIGDSAFEGCEGMTDIELCGNGKNPQLNILGRNVFRNCASLRELVLPKCYKESSIRLSMFEGCKSLQHITAQSDVVDVVADETFGFKQFEETVPATFYFEGPNSSALHTTATQNAIAFKVIDGDIYEITKIQGNLRAVYQVNSHNELIYCNIPAGMTEVELPNTIGPYQITAIDSSSFQRNCALEKITIPSSITRIDANAFKGCHNLKTVIFKEPVNLQTIGANAFQTQLVEGSHSSGCPGTLDQSPVLQFVGPISYDCVPFSYAMDEGSNINVGSQYRTYITYYGSWPQNLQVRYNHLTDRNELINYPTFDELKKIASMTREEALANYPCMTENTVDDYLVAVQNALAKTGPNPTNKDPLTDYEHEILNATVDIVLPDGIESIAQGLFSSKEAVDVGYGLEKKITAVNLTEIDDDAFAGCVNLKGAYFVNGCRRVGDHAFSDCFNLDSVRLPASVNEMGLKPFIGCGQLEHVDFQGNPKYTCSNSIIYETDDAGNKIKVVEYLQGRQSGVVNAAELAGIKEIAEEAFRGTGVSYADLRSTEITMIPARTFQDTKLLSFVYLPRTWSSIEEDAFLNSNLQFLEIPGSQGVIDNSAFDNHAPSLTFCCEEGSSAQRYALQHNILVTDKEPEYFWTVRFWDDDNNLLDTQTVKGGEDAIPPEPPAKEGFVFVKWTPDYHGISRDMDITAKYEKEDPDAHKVTVTFMDYDGRVIDTQRVAIGEDAVPPADPVREGYVFTAWVPAFTNVTADISPVAQYVAKDERYTVRFLDYDGSTVLSTQLVFPHNDAVLPKDPVRAGYIFTGWLPKPVDITADVDTYAQYERDEQDVTGVWYTVRFFDDDGVTLLYQQQVRKGDNAILPQSPVKTGYLFKGWMPSPVNIDKDLDVYARYDKIEEPDTTPPGNNTDPGNNDDPGTTNPPGGGDDGSGSGNNGGGNNGGGGGSDNDNNGGGGGTTNPDPVPDPGNNDSGNNNNGGGGGTTNPDPVPDPGNNDSGNENNNSTQPTTKFYTLTVRNGSGSGSYAAGSQPIIVAADPAAGQEFSDWSIDPSDTKIASKVLSATVITMPERDVTVTANYKKASTTSTGTGSGNSTGTNAGGSNVSYTPATPTRPGKGSTTVVIDKNGLSNTSVISATVNGSSDNFVIKITESAGASELAVKALMAEYGDVTNIKYFPMDISLYDSTGTKMITDTSGLSISITLPLPDSLITYAGNNKVASVQDGRLEKLPVKFTTISGVSCVTFTAEHFSPYVIYVNTNNLTAGTISDYTPKTGDGIHPKWFLSMGLAMISIVLFMKKDKKQVVKAR